jgi:hypothetical protein
MNQSCSLVRFNGQAQLSALISHQPYCACTRYRILHCDADTGSVDQGTQKLLRHKRWRLLAVSAVCTVLALTVMFIMIESRYSSPAAITPATRQSALLHSDRHSSSNSAVQQHQQRALAVEHDGTVHASTEQKDIDSAIQNLNEQLPLHDYSDGNGIDADTAVVSHKPLALASRGNNGRVQVSYV